jgi:DNA recombination protein RmuC
MVEVMLLIVGVVIGGVIGWLLANSRLFRQFQEERELRVAAETRLQELERAREAERSLVEEVRAQLGDTFKALSADALRDNAQAFADRAKETLDPLRDALKRYEDYVRDIEGQRREAYGSIESQLKSLLASEQQLQRETGNLVTALRRPEVRGRWGEMTLHRVVELAGMTERVDYVEQVTVSGEQGRLRPDMIVHLPAGRQVVVDCKIPLDAYLSAVEASTDEERKQHLTRHCQQMRQHMNALGAKSYWAQFENTPQFAVMFVPGESFLCEAASADPQLMDDGWRQNVVLASPSILIALLRTVASGWREERLAEGARQISSLGQDLYDRLRTFAEHLVEMGKRLNGATDAYNRAVGSLESRVLPAARRFQELGAASGQEIPELEPVDTQPRQLSAPEVSEDTE